MNERQELNDEELAQVDGGGWQRRLTARIKWIINHFSSDKDSSTDNDSSTAKATPASQPFELKGPEEK